MRRLSIVAFCALFLIPLFVFRGLHAQTAAGTIFYSGGSLPSAASMNGQTIIVKNSNSSGGAGGGTYVFSSNGTAWTGVLVGGGSASPGASYSQSFTNSSSVSLTHNLNSFDLVVACYDNQSPAQSISNPAVSLNSLNQVTVAFLTQQSGTCVVK
jgi:hypothetical protein